MPSAAALATSQEYNGRLEYDEMCRYCNMQNCCSTVDPVSLPQHSSGNGSITVKKYPPQLQHTCATPMSELPGHRGADRVSFVHSGYCDRVAKKPPQTTFRGRSTQRLGRQPSSPGTTLCSDGIQRTPFPLSLQPQFISTSHNLPPPHTYVGGGRNHQNFSEANISNPYGAQFLPRKFVLSTASTESPSSMEGELPSVLLATATAADDINKPERPSRWNRARGRSRKRSPSARQRASASVIRHQGCSPPPIQRDRPPTPPSMEDSSTPSPPPTIVVIRGRPQFGYGDCPFCQPRYSQSPERIGIRPILSKKLSTDSSIPYIRETMGGSNITDDKRHLNGCERITQKPTASSSRQQRRRRARSEYRQSGSTGRRQPSPPNMIANNRTNEKHLFAVDFGNSMEIMEHEQQLHQQHQHQHHINHAKNPYSNNPKHLFNHKNCRSTTNLERNTSNRLNHENQPQSFTPKQQQQTDLNGNENGIIDTRTNDYEEPMEKPCKENLRKKFSCNNRSISKSSKSRRQSRKGQQKVQDEDLQALEIINRKMSCPNSDITLEGNRRKASNIARSKSRSRYGQLANNGLQTIWPAKAGIWLPQ